MACYVHVLFIILMLMCSEILCKINRNKSSNGCFIEIICGDSTTNLSRVVEGLSGPHGSQGATGLPGPMGPQGLAGPPGRDGFSERPIAFCAELRHFDHTNNIDNILRSCSLSDSYNMPTVSEFFSEHTGIFTVPKNGLYQFFVTISVSRTKASFDITKNGDRMCNSLTESIIQIQNETIAFGWSQGFIECLLYCQIGDEISVVTSYVLNVNSYSETLPYSYSLFSGFMLFNT